MWPYSYLDLLCVANVLLAILVVALGVNVWYNLCFNRLRSVPGPRLNAVSRIPYIYATLTGQLPRELHRLHQKYGPVVRTAPSEVSFIQHDAARTIYARKNPATGLIFPKNYDSWSETSNYFNHTIFLVGNGEGHARIRRVFGAAFSERMLREHESTILKNVDCFIDQLRSDIASSPSPSSPSDETASPSTIDLDQRLHWLAFDTVAEFVFGFNFDTMRSSAYRPWLHRLSQTWKFIAFISSLKQLVAIAVTLLGPTGLLQSRVDALQMLDAKSEELMDKSTGKPTLLSVGRSSVKDGGSGEKGSRQERDTLSRLELIANVSLFTVAGTDTVATVMPSIIFLLLSHPEALDRLLQEVRTIDQEADITNQRVKEFRFLTACIMEAQRLYPAVPEGLPRVVPGVGEEISGHWIPSGTAVQISSYAAYRSPDNFDSPDSFIPDRWLPDTPASKNDPGRGVFLPFSTGPRGCIGQDFAMAEIRLLLVKLFFHFDLSLSSGRDWMDQRCFLLWERKPLRVELVPRTKGRTTTTTSPRLSADENESIADEKREKAVVR